MVARRDVGPVLSVIRDFLERRKTVNMLRFRDQISARTQPPPKLPEGPHTKLSSNYYYSRDARGIVKPDVVLVDGNTILKLPGGENKTKTVVERVPGKVTNWDM